MNFEFLGLPPKQFTLSMQAHGFNLPKLSYYANENKKISDWDYVRFKFEGAQGYFTDYSSYGRGVALQREGSTWMSITPLEMESALIAEHSAKGKVVVAGLGLGMISLSLLQKRNVREVIVLDIDEGLINNFESMLDGKSLKLWRSSLSNGRLKLFQCDCKSELPDHVVRAAQGADYLWCDIWKDLFTDEAKIDTEFLQSQIKAKLVDYWGVELDLGLMILKKYGEKKNPKSNNANVLNPDNLLDVASELSLPLSVKGMQGKKLKLYTELITKSLELSAKAHRLRKSHTHPIQK